MSNFNVGDIVVMIDDKGLREKEGDPRAHPFNLSLPEGPVRITHVHHDHSIKVEGLPWWLFAWRFIYASDFSPINTSLSLEEIELAHLILDDLNGA